MSTISIETNEHNFFTPINNQFIDKYMAEAHGDYIKVYIYLLRLFSTRNKFFETSEIASMLDLTESDVLKAIKYWTKKGLIATSIVDDEIKAISVLHDANDSPVMTKIEKPNSNAKQSVDTTIVPFKKSYDAKLFEKYSNDDDFILFTKIVGKYFSKNLTVDEISILINLLDHYNFSYDALGFLVDHLAENEIKNVKSLESKCLSLVQNGISSLKDIKTFTKKNNKVYTKILKKMCPNLDTYHIDEDDIFLMDKWLYDYGFNIEMVCFACDKTNKFLKTKELKYKINYCNKIIDNWHNKGIKSLDQIKKLEANSTKKPSSNRKKTYAFDEHSYDFEAIEEQSLQDLEERVKNIK